MRAASSLVVLVAAALVACGPAPVALVRVDALAPGAECPFGGEVVVGGVDGDHDGVLAESEISSRQTRCGEAPPAATLLKTEVIPAGSTCADGGLRFASGLDDDGSGTLDDGEIDSSVDACRMSGSKRLASVTAVPAGATCGLGGQRIAFGDDVDGDGTVDAEEEANAFTACFLPGGGTELRGGAIVRDAFELAAFQSVRRVAGTLSLYLPVTSEVSLPMLEEVGSLFLSPTFAPDWARAEAVDEALTAAENAEPPTEPAPGAALKGPGAIRFPALVTIRDSFYATQYPDLRGLDLPVLASVTEMNVQSLVRLEQLGLGALGDVRILRITGNKRLEDCELKRMLARLSAIGEIDTDDISGNDGASCVNGASDCHRVVGEKATYLYCVLPRPQAGAAADCAALGGRLPVVPTPAQRRDLWRSKPPAFAYESAWIGVSDRETEGTWLWVDGTPVSSPPWSRDEPNDAGGNEDCVAMYLQWTEYWNDSWCDASWPVICELPAE